VLDGNEKTQKLAQTYLLPAYAFWAVSIAQMHVVAAMYMDKLVHLVKVRGVEGVYNVSRDSITGDQFEAECQRDDHLFVFTEHSTHSRRSIHGCARWQQTVASGTTRR
jgi:hypothetical protein